MAADGNVFELSLNKWMWISDFLNIWNRFYRSITFYFFSLNYIFSPYCDDSFHRCSLFWKCFDISPQMSNFAHAFLWKRFHLNRSAMKTDRKPLVPAHKSARVHMMKIFFKYARKYWIELKWWWYVVNASDKAQNNRQSSQINEMRTSGMQTVNGELGCRLKGSN